MPPSMKVVTCSLDELDEKPNHTKTLKSWNFKGKGYKAKNSFSNHLKKKLWSMVSKCLTLGANHMCKK
jgi:hypothetical protein